jgi:hypothetical protein
MICFSEIRSARQRLLDSEVCNWKDWGLSNLTEQARQVR